MTTVHNTYATTDASQYAHASNSDDIDDDSKQTLKTKLDDVKQTIVKDSKDLPVEKKLSYNETKSALNDIQKSLNEIKNDKELSAAEKKEKRVELEKEFAEVLSNSTESSKKKLKKKIGSTEKDFKNFDKRLQSREIRGDLKSLRKEYKQALKEGNMSDEDREKFENQFKEKANDIRALNGTNSQWAKNVELMPQKMNQRHEIAKDIRELKKEYRDEKKAGNLTEAELREFDKKFEEQAERIQNLQGKSTGWSRNIASFVDRCHGDIDFSQEPELVQEEASEPIPAVEPVESSTPISSTDPVSLENGSTVNIRLQDSSKLYQLSNNLMVFSNFNGRHINANTVDGAKKQDSLDFFQGFNQDIYDILIVSNPDQQDDIDQMRAAIMENPNTVDQPYYSFGIDDAQSLINVNSTAINGLEAFVQEDEKAYDAFSKQYFNQLSNYYGKTTNFEAILSK